MTLRAPCHALVPVARVALAAVAAVALADVTGAQVAAARDSLEQANELLRRERAEEAAGLLRSAWRQFERAEPSEQRNEKALRSSIENGLRRVDPRALDLLKVQQRTAAKLVEVAQEYARAGWPRTALDLLEQARRLDPGSVGGEVERIRALLPAVDADRLTAELLAAPDRGWFMENGELVSPAIAEGGGPAQTVHVLAPRSFDGDRRMSLEVLLGNRPGKAGFVFAGRGELVELYMVELVRRVEDTSIRLMHLHDGRFDLLAMKGWTFPKEIQDGWLPVEVTIRGRELTVAVGDLSPFHFTAPTDVVGAPGIYISGDTPNREPLRFRHLVIESL